MSVDNNTLLNESANHQLGRILWIDGMKFVACLAVFFAHFYSAFYLQCDAKPDLHPAIVFLTDVVFRIFAYGNFWVCVFILLSGYFATKKRVDTFKGFLRACVERYLRFVIPLFVAHFIIWGIDKCGLFYSAEVGGGVQQCMVRQPLCFKY